MIEKEEMGPEVPKQFPVAQKALIIALIDDKIAVLDMSEMSPENITNTFGKLEQVGLDEGVDMVRVVHENNTKAQLFQEMLPQIGNMIRAEVGRYQEEFVANIKKLKADQENNKELLVPGKKKN
jgi:hypothetical protein